MSHAVQLVYTVCFLKQENKLLLLNREAPPNMGLWNGVGGKIEPGESPYQSAIREIQEETGLQVEQLQFGGIVTWARPTEADMLARQGMYLFLAELSQSMKTNVMPSMDEGILAWKQLDWVLNPQNMGVASNISVFLPRLLNRSEPKEYYCTYEQNQLIHCEVLSVPKQVDPMKPHAFPALKC